MSILTEGRHTAEFLVSEAEDNRSRETVTVASGQDLDAGAVLGKLTKRQAAAAIPTNAGTGSGAMTALTFGPDVQVGSYVIALTETSATAAFTVTAPDGTSLPNGAVGTAYTSDHVNFTVANAGTMTAGDYYILIVANGTEQVEAWDPTAVDGTQDAYGILYAAVDASSAATAGVAIVRNAQINSDELTWATTVTGGQKPTAINQLAAAGIIAR